MLGGLFLKNFAKPRLKHYVVNVYLYIYNIILYLYIHFYANTYLCKVHKEMKNVKPEISFQYSSLACRKVV